MEKSSDKTRDPRSGKKDKKKTGVKRKILNGMAEKWVFFACAAFSIIAVLGIIVFILIETVPAFSEIGFFNFLFGTKWAPSQADTEGASNVYGILPMIVGSLCVTLGALILGGILGVFAALFLVYWCPEKLKKPFEQIINLFAGIPSIIFGFFGMAIIVPAIAAITGTDTGYGILASSLILMLMILPTVASMSKNALKSVPEPYFEGALALGATKEQAVFTVMLPAARSGVISGLIMGTGRAIGETMAVILVAGNAAAFPEGLISNIRTLTTNIALEMSYATGLHRNALVATGFILLIFVLIINFSVGLVKKDFKGSNKARKMTSGKSAAPVYRQKGLFSIIGKYVSYVLSALIVVSLLGILIYVVVNGIANISPQFLFGRSSYSSPSLVPAFAATGMIILVALGIAFPIGTGAAIFLHEYSKPGSKIVRAIRLFTDTLSGIPSIIYALFGNILFCSMMGLSYSILSGSLTMAIMILPTIVRSVEESLIAVPDSLREASLACGASKLYTLIHVVLPQALPGMLTAGVLSIGRIVGESAALIYTAGTSTMFPNSGYMSPCATFAVLIYYFVVEGRYMGEAYATAFVLIILVAIIYVVLGLIEHFFGADKREKKSKKSEKLKVKTT